MDTLLEYFPTHQTAARASLDNLMAMLHNRRTDDIHSRNIVPITPVAPRSGPGRLPFHQVVGHPRCQVRLRQGETVPLLRCPKRRFLRGTRLSLHTPDTGLSHADAIMLIKIHNPGRPVGCAKHRPRINNSTPVPQWIIDQVCGQLGAGHLLAGRGDPVTISRAAYIGM